MLLKINHNNIIFQLSLFGPTELSEYTGDELPFWSLLQKCSILDNSDGKEETNVFTFGT